MNKSNGMNRVLKLTEKHSLIFWYSIRLIEIITCFFIIAGVIRHW